jgi:hypothetical protein
VIHVSADGRRSDGYRMLVLPTLPQQFSFATPKPKPARIRIVTDDDDDRVMVGNVHFDSRRGEVQLAPGEYRITISRKGAITKITDLVLRENESRDLRFSLERRSGNSLPWVLGALGVVALGAAGTAAYFAFRPTEYQGAQIGTLNPGIARANY